MKRMSLSIVAAAGIAILLLSGCSGQTSIKALDRDATADDALPAFVTAPNPANTETARLLATRDGVRYFVSESDDSLTACLAIVPPGDSPSWHMGCGSNNGSDTIVELYGEGGAVATLLADDADTGKIEAGWTKIADNILISDH